MKILVFSGSLRQGSFNTMFAREAHRLLTEAGHSAEFVNLRDFDIPLYDGDVEMRTGIPQGAAALGQKIAAVDALVVSSPEYNAGISGVFKNTLDWLSRIKPGMPLAGRHILLLAATPGRLAGIRALRHTRPVLDELGMFTFPASQGLGQAGGAFDEKGHLTDEKTLENLKNLLERFASHVSRFAD